MDEKIKLVFDDESKVRALDPSKYSRVKEIHKECQQFMEKISHCQEKTKTLVQILDSQSKKIDYEKLRVCI
jgi:hypothetical protein